MVKKINSMPNNLEAEQALISCMLIDNEILADVLDGLFESDFYQESHKYILSAVKTIFGDRKPVDIVTLCDRLDASGNLAKAGGIEYITEIAQAAPSAANYKHYLDIVKRDGINRKLMRAAADISEYASESDSSAKSIQHAEKLIYDISMVNDSSSVKDIREGSGILAVMDKFEKIHKDKNAFRGISTGLTRLDKLTNGLQKSDLIVIAARPGMGKTSLAMNFVEHAAVSQGAVCAVFSLEMPETQIIQRLLCSVANVSMSNALSGKLDNSNDWRKLIKAGDTLKKAPIFIDDSARVTPAEIFSKCRRIKAKNDGRLDLVMIDYIQLMSSGKEDREQNRTQIVADITRDLKIMAKELNVPVIALSQLRRIQTGEPQLSDLRESGAIEQDADIVMFIHRPDVNMKDEDIAKKGIKKGMADLIIAKHRNGSQDRIPLRFKGETTKFVNPDPDQQGYEAPPVKSAQGGSKPSLSRVDEKPPFDEEEPYNEAPPDETYDETSYDEEE